MSGRRAGLSNTQKSMYDVLFHPHQDTNNELLGDAVRLSRPGTPNLYKIPCFAPEQIILHRIHQRGKIL